jgi:beta-lactam-binding protein with PASTA domain
VSSRRPPSFTVTAAGEKVKLDDSGSARAQFTVTNTSPQARKGRLLTRPREPAKPEWFSVVGESIRDFAPNAAQQAVVELKVQPGSPPGSYSFRLDAVSEDDPDEDFTEGPSVAFEVAPPAKPPKPFPWWILIVAGAVVLLIVIGIVVWLLVRDTGPKTKPVPSVIGLSAAAAQSTLTNAGFTMKTRSTPVTDPAQNGVVQSQNPAAGTAQPPGTEVTVTVGHMSLVPAVTGLAEDKAKSAIAKADLKAAVRDVPANQAQQGIVQSQDPAAGTLQTPGTVVTIAVGGTVAVPSVVGRPVDAAVDVLTNAGLRVRVVRDHRGFPPNDNVQSQSPPAGARVPLETVVSIVIFVV